MRGFPFRTLLLRKKKGKEDEGRGNKGLKGIGSVQEFFINEQVFYLTTIKSCHS